MAHLTEPQGDPTAIRLAAIRLTRAAEDAVEVGEGLQLDAGRVQSSWTGLAQKLFSLLAETVGKLMSGSGRIADDFSGDLARYAQVLEFCQHEVGLARSQLEAAGPIPDPSAVASSVDKARNAGIEAAEAARTLSRQARELMGGTRGGETVWNRPQTGGACFVSQTHCVSAGLVSGAPQGSFDSNAASVEAQLGSVLGAMVPGPNKSIAVLPAGSSPLAGSALAIVIGPQASTVEGSIMLRPGTGTGAATVLLGAQGPLTSSPGVVVLPPGVGSPPTNVAILPPYFDTTTAYLLSGPSPELQAQIAEYQAYVNSPAYQANLETSQGDAYEAVNLGLAMGAIRNSQDWTSKYNQSIGESISGTDMNLSGQVGDVDY